MFYQIHFSSYTIFGEINEKGGTAPKRRLTRDFLSFLLYVYFSKLFTFMVHRYLSLNRHKEHNSAETLVKS
jgi:hypothetical protein